MIEDNESRRADASNLTTISETKSGSFKLKNSTATIMDNNKQHQVTDYSSTFNISMPENPTLASQTEYLRNKTHKRTNIISMKPEIAGMIDKRIAESTFNADNEQYRSKQIVNDAKALRLNRRQMQKNVPLEHSFEPMVTTK